jgi:hypothetical protein
MTSGSTTMAALIGGSRDPSPLWLYDGQGWWQPADEAPGFILAMARLPDGGLLVGTGRDISDQPGVFLLTGGPPGRIRLYDSQAVGALAVSPNRQPSTSPGVTSDIYAAAAPWADREAGSEMLRREAADGSWNVLLQGSLICGQMTSYFRQVTIAPSEPSTILALEWCLTSYGGHTRLWRSDDRGKSWHVLPREAAAYPLIGTLAVDPEEPDLLYVAGLDHLGNPPAGIERSIDGGQTWDLKGRTVEGLTSVRALLVDARDPRRIVAGTEQHGVFASHDRGEIWHLLPGLEGLRVGSLAIDEATDRLYAATDDGVWSVVLP